MSENKNGDLISWPQDVGIVAIEIYFPFYYVDQKELEDYDKVSSGKYTIGLGQAKMGFCSDREDVNSLCLTVVQRLMERTGVSYKNIGRLEVGTETILDKSKSVKTVLMQLFEESGNFDVEGVDTTNACYGGTAALLNAVNWVESGSWDGRYALVVAGDIAIYAQGNARPTGGAGAVAMLIGAHAPLVVERGMRASHMAHVYDFYKPDLMSEYPRVDGKLSVVCYARGLDKCYEGFCRKAEHILKREHKRLSLDDMDAVLFHAPYCKLVQKSLGRLVLNDFLRDSNPDMNGKYKGLDQYRNLKLEDTYLNKDVEKVFLQHSYKIFEEKTKPGLLIANQVGNMYTPSLYGCLSSYIANKTIQQLSGIRVAMFSYGSGMAATLYSLRFSSDTRTGSSLEKLHSSLKDLQYRLDSRKKVSAAEFSSILKLREETHHKAPYTPVGKVEDLYPGTWYLTEVDDNFRRHYECKPSEPFCHQKNPSIVSKGHNSIDVGAEKRIHHLSNGRDPTSVLMATGIKIA